MQRRNLTLYLAWGAAVVLGGLLGGLNYAWAHSGTFGVYGYVVDILAVGALVALVLYVRKKRGTQTDEFAVTKKRTAALTGMIFGFVAFGVGALARAMFAHAYHAMLDQMPDRDSIFVLGLTAGMAPFAIGLLVGQVVAWRKYQ